MREAVVTDPRYASYSSLTQHRKCPQQWYYARVRKLEQAEEETSRIEATFGSWWHAMRAADSIERGRALDSLRYAPETLTISEGVPPIKVTDGLTPSDVLVAAAAWWDTMSTTDQEAWEERLGGPLRDRLTYMDDRYRERWAEERKQERPLGVEVKWERDLPSLPQRDGEVDPNTRLVGYVDEVYQDGGRGGMIVVRDHKTGKKLASQTVLDDMVDSQLQLYAWGLAPLVSEWGLGSSIRAVAYDRARSVAPSTPELTLTGTLKKTVTDYDLHTYLQWAKDGVPWGEEGAVYASGPRKGQPKFGTYLPEDKVVAHLSDPASQSAWFQRTLTPLNMNLVRTHLRSAVDTSLDTQRTFERAEITGHAPRNLTNACRWCEFVTLCRSEMVGGEIVDLDPADYGLQRRRPRVR